jgi:phosphoribosyl 1,2-cyclic phosphodiesterase
MVDVTFYGVRGSCPSPCEANRRYGGNTACVVLGVDGQPPIILDLGTGLRAFGETQPVDGTFRASAFVTHLHWDHVQGLPFFPPIDRVGAELDVYGPVQAETSLGGAFGELMRPPYFPVRLEELRGRIRFHDQTDGDLAIGDAKVTVRTIPHVGPTLGYRVAWAGRTVAYISDHQAPVTLDSVADSALELADGADVLIHDAQYTPDEFQQKAHWGHCTADYALQVAREAGVGTLVLFHHDPAHDDDAVDGLLAGVRRAAGGRGPEILAASEGLILHL